MTDPLVPPGLDTSQAHPARMYDYYLWGKDNFEADRAAADKVLANFPAMRTTALENRAFLRRVVHHLAADLGVRRFIDIGTGIPTANNTHEVAQRAAPESHIVYVDNDPIVLVHARALLQSHPAGETAYVEADLRDPDAILGSQEVRDMLDAAEPVALLLFSILQFVTDEDDAHRVVARLVSALPPGSYLAISHATGDFLPQRTAATGTKIYDQAGIPLQLRTRAEIARFFDGHELLDPGLVPISEWRAEEEPLPRPSLAEAALYGAVARIAS